MFTPNSPAQQGLLPGLPDPNYPMPSGIFDEMMVSPSVMRPHWVELMQRIDRLGREEMERRWARGEKLIRDNGVTYNIYGDPEGHGRPWSLDPLPLIVSAAEWRQIETAVIQRARLLNKIIADLYGRRSLIQEGRLPPTLLYANPGFLRPLDGIQPKDGVFLHFYAVDLARSPDGQWWVVSDRTDAPSGAGYALENRIITSRILPDVYRESQVHRLAPFFMKMRDTLTKLAPRGTDNPRIVLWTPGPYNETHYEHVYLARYLGITLVQGQDMTCRDGRVYLKTLEGLKPVDVIIRRNEGSWCDPLELRGDSQLGVPGLVEAAHAGTVTIANALGSRVVEAPGFMPFLPGLCRRLLGEDLLMPSVATWWCGQETEQNHVLDNLGALALRPAFNAHGGLITGRELDERYRDALLDQVRIAPWNFVGQENVRLSTAPIWTPEGISPRPLVMRLHLAAHEDGYIVMPGALSRVAHDRDKRSVSMQSGGESKDTWVLSDAPVKPISLMRTGGIQHPIRGARDLPSRVADNTFWLGRYTERCEDTARLLRKACEWAIENGFGTPELEVTLSLFSLLGQLPIDRDYKTAEAQCAALVDLLDSNAESTEPLGLANMVTNVRRAAETVRDRLSTDTWRAITNLSASSEKLADLARRTERSRKRNRNRALAKDKTLRGTAAALDRSQHVPIGQLAGIAPGSQHGTDISKGAESTTSNGEDWDPLKSLDAMDLQRYQNGLDDMVMTLLALDGLALENMTRGLGWRFLDMGRRVERALHVLDLLTALLMVDEPAEIGAVLDVILDMSDSTMTYRSRYLALPTLVPVLDVVMADESNPRALAYQLARLSGHVDSLATDQAFGLRNAEQRKMISLLAKMRTVDLVDITLTDPSQQNGSNGEDRADPSGKQPLSDLLINLRNDLIAFSESLTLHYFAHAVERRADLEVHPDLKAVVDAKEEDEKPSILPLPDPETAKDSSEEASARAASAGLEEMAQDVAEPVAVSAVQTSAASNRDADAAQAPQQRAATPPPAAQASGDEGPGAA